MRPRTRRLATAALSAVPAGGALLRERRQMREALARRAAEEKSIRTAALVDPVIARPPPSYTISGPVTSDLHARLTQEDLAELSSRLEGDAYSIWHETPPEHRMRLALVLSAFYALPGALERTGLTAAEPPEDVHAMARGPLASGGDASIADVVVESLLDAGFALDDGHRVLDFGCSSGRVLRALAAWRTDLECIGCDPNAAAIAWAQEHLPMARFFASQTTPPLELADASIDSAFAISIWSHFDAESALVWLEEMRRVIVPGGALLITTHGLDSIGGFLRGDDMDRHSAATALTSMLRSGHQYYDVFGDEGDWGVHHAGWGNAYLSLMWLAREATPAWSVRLFREGALAANQDVVVLERRP